MSAYEHLKGEKELGKLMKRCVVQFIRDKSSSDSGFMINMHADEQSNIKECEIQFQDLWCAPLEYQLLTIKHLVGRTELV